MKRLRDFWSRQPAAEAPLRGWYRTARKAKWNSVVDARVIFPHADAVTLHCGIVVTIFNISGNHFRLVTRINYQQQFAYVKAVLTHAEYDREKWKERICRD